jgi:hypothetical protein
VSRPLYNDPTTADRVIRQIKNLPRTLPAVLAIQLETKHLLRLDYVERKDGYDAYLAEFGRIMADINRRGRWDRVEKEED